MSKNRLAPPEFWRFIFILFICLLHFEEDVYDKNHLIAQAGYLGVDFFLILSGFVVSLNHERVPIKSSVRYCLNRVKKIYPDFIFAIILMFILWIVYDSKDLISIAVHMGKNAFQFFFINALFPTGLEMRSIWFLSYWLIGLIVLGQVLSKNKRSLFLLGLIVISFFSWHYYNRGCLFNDPAKPEYLWSIRLVKCVSEVILGALLFEIYDKICKYTLTLYGKLLLTCIESFIICFVIVAMAFDGRNILDYYVCFGFCIIIVCSFWNQSYISKLIDNNYSLIMGKMSLPIYLYHLFVIKIVSEHWHNCENKAIVYILTLVAVVLLSFLFHKLVENYFNGWLIKGINKIIVTYEN